MKFKKEPGRKHQEILAAFDCWWLENTTNLWIVMMLASLGVIAYDSILSKKHMLLVFVLTQCFVVLNLVYASNIHAQGTTAQYSPTAAWCAIPATCWKNMRIVIHSCQFQWGNIWKFPQQSSDLPTFGSLTY